MTNANLPDGWEMAGYPLSGPWRCRCGRFTARGETACWRCLPSDPNEGMVPWPR